MILHMTEYSIHSLSSHSIRRPVLWAVVAGKRVGTLFPHLL